MKCFFIFLFIYSLNTFAFDQFDAKVLHRIEEVVSVYENATTVQAYDYIEDIHDGRGYTAGKIGFTSATFDMAVVIRKYLEYRPEKISDWDDVLKLIDVRSQEHDGSVLGLEKLPSLWKKSAEDIFFKKAQDEIAFEMYMKPAQDALKLCGYNSNKALLIFYDTIVQHGYGESPEEEPDSFIAILSRVKKVPLESESAFLNEFLKLRKKVLMHSSDPSTRDAWRESVYRIKSLRKILYSSVDLNTTFSIRVWGKEFQIN